MTARKIIYLAHKQHPFFGGGNVLIINNNKDIIKELRAANHWKNGMISTSLCDKVFRKEAFKNVTFRNMFLEDIVATVDILKNVGEIGLISKGEYSYCIRENSMLTSTWTLKKCTDELESILHVYEFIMANEPHSEQALTTYLWIVFLLNQIKLQFDINYLRLHPKVNIPLPACNAQKAYDKIRLTAIKLLGIRRYVDMVVSIVKLKNKIVSPK